MNEYKTYISLFLLNRIDCSEGCKLRKQMLENECKQLRRDMSAIEELKKTAEQQSRTYEQEVDFYLFLSFIHCNSFQSFISFFLSLSFE